MYRINFKDGYKLRLTWDYIHQNASELGTYSGGTHWGQGGVVDGERQFYYVLRPRDNDDPFFIDWKSDREREIVKRIKSLHEKAIEAIKDYQNRSSIGKIVILINLYKEIQKIKVLDVNIIEENGYGSVMKILIRYENKEYQLLLAKNLWLLNRLDMKKFEKDFKNKYFRFGKELPQYLYDKSKEFLKKNKSKKNKS